MKQMDAVKSCLYFSSAFSDNNQFCKHFCLKHFYSAWLLVEIWQAVVSFSLFLLLFLIASVLVKINNYWEKNYIPPL